MVRADDFRVHQPAAGDIPFMVTALHSVVGLIESGMVKALAVTGKTRLSTMPEIRTVAEAGVPGRDSSAWCGALVRRGTPGEIREKLADAIAHALRQPDVLQRLQAEGADPSDLRGADFGRFIATERARWDEVLRGTTITVD